MVKKEISSVLNLYASVMSRKWLLISAVLFVILQVVLFFLPKMVGGTGKNLFILIQEMVSASPFLSFFCFGFDRLGRTIGINDSRKFKEYVFISKSLPIVSFVLGGICGFIIGCYQNAYLLAWVVFCSYVAGANALACGKELMIANGSVEAASKITAFILFSLCGGLILLGKLGLDVDTFALLWGGIVFFLSLMYLSSPGLLKAASIKPNTSELCEWAKKGIRAALPILSVATISLIDIPFARITLSDSNVVAYIITSRSIYVAFMFSVPYTSLAVQGYRLSASGDLLKNFVKIFVIHFKFSIGTSLIFMLGGPFLAEFFFELGIPFSVELYISIIFLAIARSAAEAMCFITTGLGDSVAWPYSGLTICFVALIYLTRNSESLSSVIFDVSLCWLLPVLSTMLMLLYKRSRGSMPN